MTTSITEVIEALEAQTKGIESFKSHYAKLHADLAAKLDKVETLAARPRGFAPAARPTLDASAEGRAFLDYARAGIVAPELKAMSIGSDPEGGYAVTAVLSTTITETIRESSPIRQVARVETITGGDALEEIVDRDDIAASWVGETQSRSDTTTPQIGKLRIPAHEIYAQPKTTQNLLDDASFDVAAWLTRKLADKFGRSENAAFVTGNGVGRPRGFASYPTAATGDATRAWGVMEHVATGTSGDFASSNPADKLIELAYKLKAPYRDEACWLMGRETARRIRQFKESTTNAYIWQPGLTEGAQDRLLGFPVYFAEDMPAIAADSLSIAFGNFRRGYLVVDRTPMRMLRDPYTDKPYVRFYTTRRVGGDVANFECIKFLKFGTS